MEDVVSVELVGTDGDFTDCFRQGVRALFVCGDYWVEDSGEKGFAGVGRIEDTD